ncbi:MAG: DUF1080 domain-containing protein [Planctomycetota bacterium]
MKLKTLATIVALLLICQMAVGQEPQSAVKPAGPKGFVSMFDGKSLKGWTVTPAKDADCWSVKDGVIRGVGKGRSYLVYDKNREIADFEMRLRYRFPKGKGNSGVSIRAIVDPTKTRGFQSYHVDFGHVGIGANVLGAWDFHTPGRKEHGAARGKRVEIDENDNAKVTDLEDAVQLKDIKRRDWNDVRIVVKGNEFKYYLNGKPSAEFIEHLPEKKRLHKGMIQLQLHDPNMIVEFDRLQIKILK